MNSHHLFWGMSFLLSKHVIHIQFTLVNYHITITKPSVLSGAQSNKNYNENDDDQNNNHNNDNLNLNNDDDNHDNDDDYEKEAKKRRTRSTRGGEE
jgi:hypothetical protein